MHDLGSRLQEKEALFWFGQVKTATLMFLKNHFVVGRRFIAEERELEAVLSVEGAMAIAAVTADLGEHRQDVSRKTWWHRLFRALHQDGRPAFKTMVNYSDRCDAIPLRLHDSVGIHAGDGGF